MAANFTGNGYVRTASNISEPVVVLVSDCEDMTSGAQSDDASASTSESNSPPQDIQLRRRTRVSAVDEAILKLVSKDADDAEAFAASIVPTLRGLPQRKRQLAKLQIQQVLYEIDSDIQ